MMLWECWWIDGHWYHQNQQRFNIDKYIYRRREKSRKNDHATDDRGELGTAECLRTDHSDYANLQSVSQSRPESEAAAM